MGIILVVYLQDKGQEQLVEKLPKTLGFGMGLEFRESSLLISSKSQATVKAGMIFNVSIGEMAQCICACFDFQVPDVKHDRQVELVQTLPKRWF